MYRVTAIYSLYKKSCVSQQNTEEHDKLGLVLIFPFSSCYISYHASISRVATNSELPSDQPAELLEGSVSNLVQRRQADNN